MKRYFYVQATEEELKDINYIKDVPEEITQDDIFIDDMENKKWEIVKHIIKQNDELYTYSIGTISLDTNDFLKKMQYLEEEKVHLFNAKKQELHIAEIIETVYYLGTRARYIGRKKQLEGIIRSLEKKKMGEGRYGRPRIKVPDDFEIKIRYMIENRMSLESYRQLLDIKRSTFYRLAREVKESWKNTK